MDQDVTTNAFLNSPYAAFILDWEGRILLCNRRAERSFCPDFITDPETLTGRHIGQLTLTSESETLLSIRQGMAAGSVSLAMQARSAARLQKPVQFRISLLRPKTKGERLFLLTQDQLKANANTLRNMNQRRANLEAKLQSVESTNAQLQDTMMSMEAFTHAASHDLRTPINTLIGSLQFFAMKYQQDLPEQAMEFLDVMARAAGQLEEMTNTLLDNALSTGRHIQRSEVQLRATVAEVIADLAPTIQANGAITQVVGEELLIQADPMLLRVVLSNLLSNALKYKSPHRRPEIIFTLKSLENEGWELIVSDNGRGFSQGDKDRIFLPFHRAHPDTDGSGVGLATCVEICKRHDWLFTASAEPEKGAAFVISNVSAELAPRQ